MRFTSVTSRGLRILLTVPCLRFNLAKGIPRNISKRTFHQHNLDTTGIARLATRRSIQDCMRRRQPPAKRSREHAPFAKRCGSSWVRCASRAAELGDATCVRPLTWTLPLRHVPLALPHVKAWGRSKRSWRCGVLNTPRKNNARRPSVQSASKPCRSVIIVDATARCPVAATTVRRPTAARVSTYARNAKCPW